jgi:hypothetical protein
MTCRVARSFQNYARREPACCCECGSTYLEEFLTSKTVGPRLCSICAQSVVERGASKELSPEPVRCLVSS